MMSGSNTATLKANSGLETHEQKKNQEYCTF